MNTLYLHIGTHKTATTTIQHFLAENNEVLKTKGYTYPRFPFVYPYRGADRNGLFLGTPYIDYDGERQINVEEQNYKEGMDIIHELFETYPNIVVSNERLWFDLFRKKGALMQKLLDDGEAFGYQIKLIVYVRRQDEYIEAFWNEMIKSDIHEVRSLNEYINDFQHLKYGKIFSRLGNMAGDENLIMRRFDEVVHGRGMLADFMDLIGLELTDEYKISKDTSNTRIYGNVLEIKKIINEMDGLDRRDATFLRAALQMSSETSMKKYPCSELSEEERTALMKPFEEENEMLAERFIGDGKPLFSTDYSGLPKRQVDNPEFLNDVIRTSAAGDVVLLRRIKESEVSIRKLEKTIAKLEAKLEKQDAKIDKLSVRVDHLRHPVKALLNRNKKNK